MPRIDFYVTKEAGVEARNRLCARIIEKAYLQGNKVFVLFDDAELANAFERLLWTLRDVSFVPHAFYKDEDQPEPVLLGINKVGPKDPDVIFNLSAEAVPDAEKYKRIVEVITNDAVIKKSGRAKYKRKKSNQGRRVLSQKEGLC